MGTRTPWGGTVAERQTIRNVTSDPTVIRIINTVILLAVGTFMDPIPGVLGML